MDAVPELQPRLLTYLELLAKWNTVYNLTATQDAADIVSRHLLDSLAIVPFVRGTRVADVGSGAGFPGIPVASARPEMEIVLIDSREKRARFLRHVVRVLNLPNVEVALTRVEDYRPVRKFDTLLCRGLTSLADLFARTEHLCASHGQILALKGKYPAAELDELSQQGFSVTDVKPVEVPSLDAERYVVIISMWDRALKTGPSPPST